MKNNNIRIIVPEKRYAGADATDINNKIFLESDHQEFVESERNIMVDLAEQFNTERQASEKYRIYGKVSPFFSNAYTGTTNYEPLLNSLWLTSDPLISNSVNYSGYPPYNEFAFIRTDVTREVANRDNTTSEVIGNDHIEIFPHNADEYNWMSYVTYVFDKDESTNIKYTNSENQILNFTVSDGIPVQITFNTKERLVICECPVGHGLSETDYVLIKGILFKVDSLGNNLFNSETTVFNLQLAQVNGTGITEGLHTFKRVIDPTNVSESTSKYYIHKHKVLSAFDDFIVDKCGFEQSIFEDDVKLEFENPDGRKEVYKEKERGEVLLYHYKKILNRLEIKDNFDLPVSEVYISILNRNGMGFFTPPKVGWSFNFHDTYSDFQFSGNSSIETAITSTQTTINNETFSTGNTLSVGSILTGAFVEYNKYEQKERIVSEAFHKFAFKKEFFDHGQDNGTIYKNSSSSNLFGYFYQPHHRITLKRYSSYIEESSSNQIDNFPQNAIYYQKDRIWKWRELYDHGFIDDNGIGVDYPFINGVHYIKFHIPFYIRSEYHFQNKQEVVTPFLSRRWRGC